MWACRVTFSLAKDAWGYDRGIIGIEEWGRPFSFRDKSGQDSPNDRELSAQDTLFLDMWGRSDRTQKRCDRPIALSAWWQNCSNEWKAGAGKGIGNRRAAAPCVPPQNTLGTQPEHR